MDETNYESFQALFPMRMTSIEKFHLFDDCPEFPNLVFCRLRIAGKVDESVARRAWQFAVQRQPFGDVKASKVKGRWCWVSGPRGDGESNQDFETWDGTRFEFEEFSVRPADWCFAEHRIRSATGSYLGVFVGPAADDDDSDFDQAGNSDSLPVEPRPDHVSEIWLYVHHAVGDGAGSILVINDWMMIYANLLSGRPPEKGLHRLDPELLQQRNSLGILSWRYLKHLYKQPIALFGATKFVFRKTAALIPKPTVVAPGEHKDCYPSIIGQWIEEGDVDSLADHARQHQVMLNSVLLGQLYLALDDWRKDLAGHSGKDWMRIILPMSIRNVSDRRLPTANRATIVQVDRRQGDMQDLGGFYRGLNREILIIRGWQLDKIFLLAIRAMAMFEPWLKRAASNKQSRGMAVFTNLGEPLRKSERASSRDPQSESFLRPFEFDLVGPIRSGTPVNFSASKYGSRLRISLQFDSQLLSSEHAKGLLKLYVDRLRAV